MRCDSFTGLDLREMEASLCEASCLFCTDCTKVPVPSAEPSLTTSSISSPFRLVTTRALRLSNTDFRFLTVSPEHPGSWSRLDHQFVIVGDTKHTPRDMQVYPALVSSGNHRFTITVSCLRPPLFLPKGNIVAQAIPIREGDEVLTEDCPSHCSSLPNKHLEAEAKLNDTPHVAWAQRLGSSKPRLECRMSKGRDTISIRGMLDTGADVTIIPAREWPSHWELQNVGGCITGVGGSQLAKQSKSIVQITGPDGQLAHVRPFVLNYSEPLWGRDTLEQWGAKIDLPAPLPVFRAAVVEERATWKLNWKSDKPVQVKQWPLNKQKLKALTELVEEQVRKGNLVETMSAWNSPVFVIRKASGKWRLLHDLRKINEIIEDMGVLQPGMPSPSMLPQNWNLAIIDLKDCFFQIPLHPDDAPRFAFTVPALNREAPGKRYHWRVLPQGMKCSPIICQWYVAALLAPIRERYSEAVIHHYMDDVLICARDDSLLVHVLTCVTDCLVAAGFELQSEKIQRMPPWKYLGLEISKRTIVPQKLAINPKVSTLADAHQLCGALNWVRPWLGITTEDLAPLFKLLEGGEALCSPRDLTPEAKASLEKIGELLEARQAHRYIPGLPFKFIILGRLPHLHGLIYQWDRSRKKSKGKGKDPSASDPLLIIEWVFLRCHRSKRITQPHELVAELIRKARLRIRELAGVDFGCIHVPLELKSGKFKTKMLNELLSESEVLQFALVNYTGQIDVGRPSHPLFNDDLHFKFSTKRILSRVPLDALTVFTDASGGSHKSVMTWKDPQTQRWEMDVNYVEGSPQVAELDAVVRAFEKFQDRPFNLVTDSAYVAGVVARAEQAVLQDVPNPALYNLLSKLIDLISRREQMYYVMHTRSHTDLPGFVAEGNRRADALAAPAEIEPEWAMAAVVKMAPLPDVFQQAKLSHQLFHQNAPGLVRQFDLTRDQAKAIVATCPQCQQSQPPSLPAGANPRGLSSCEVWQTDVTKIPQFGRLKYVHVSVDTFSSAVFASAHAGERASDVQKHLIQAFSVLGIPKRLKTDNGPAYVSRELRVFLQRWGIEHRTGIPYSPTGQAVIERTHQNLKRVLSHLTPAGKMESPQVQLSRALYTLNFLNCSFDNLNPAIVRHFGGHGDLRLKERPPVLVRDPETWRQEGPFQLVTWGRGYACVSTPSGPKWVPSRWVRPYVPRAKKTPNPVPQVAVASWRRRRKPGRSPLLTGAS